MNLEITHEILGYVAGALMIIGMFPYVRSIVSTKETKLNRASWAIWGAIGLINFGAYFAAGERETIWFVLIGAINPCILFALSLKFGEKQWYWTDTACVLLAALALLVWKMTGNPVLAIATCITADALAIIPTMIKICRDPYSENLTGWVIGFVASVCNLLAVKSWTWANGIYTGYMVVGFLAILVPLIVLRRFKKAATTIS